MKDLEDVLKVKDERREGQRIVAYDRLFKALQDKAKEFDLPVPEVLMSKFIDRTSITHFNSSDQVR